MGSVWLRKNKGYQTPYAGEHPRVSVIIAVRNEAANISALIDDLSEQTYPTHLTELIIIDDGSSDGTRELIQEKAVCSELKIINQPLELPPDFSGSHKKLALGQAVKVSTGEVLLFTDGDCRIGPDWIAIHVPLFEGSATHFISGPVQLTDDGYLFTKLQNLELAGLIGAGGAGMALGFPNMSNGANMGVRRSVFDAIEGFRGYEKIHSGDDQFLMLKINRDHPGTVKFNFDSRSTVFTQAAPTAGNFVQQRLRWAGKWKHYPDYKVISLALFIFGYYLITLVGLVMAFFGLFPWLLFGKLMLIKIFIDFFFIQSVLGFWRKTVNPIHFMIMEIVYPFYSVIFGLASNWSNYTWKGRSGNSQKLSVD